MIRIAQMMRAPRGVFRRDDGFSLIEVLVSLFIFTLLTLGLVPLLTSSLRASNGARADTIGKNAALKAMERVRGLPYHVSYATSPTKVDLLDLYYPNAGGATTVPGPKTFYRTICTSTSLANPACPRDIAAGYTVTFEAQFVDVVAGGAQPTAGENATSYASVAPSSTYNWNSATTDTPPRQILQMTIITTWSVGEQNESYSITSLITDRSFGGRKTKATASLSYGLDVYTAYDTRRGGTSFTTAGNAFVTTSESDIEARRLSSALQATTAARAELEEATGGGTLGVIDGATTNLKTPPDQNPGTISAPERVLRHPQFANLPLAAFGPTRVLTVGGTGPTASALTAPASFVPPAGTGDSEISGIISGSVTDYFHMKDPQLNNEDFNNLNLAAPASQDPAMVSLVASNGLPSPLTGITDPLSTPATTGRFVVGGTRSLTTPTQVQSQATTGFDRMLLLKSNFIPTDNAPVVTPTGTSVGTISGTQGAIIIVDDFQAAVACESTTAGGGDARAGYSATVYYWEDTVPNNRRDGRYVRLTLPADAGQLATIAAQNANNGPRVYDGGGNQDIYLFGKTLGKATGGERAAYLSSWGALTAGSIREDPSTDPTGAAVTSANASINGAFEIETADLDRTKQIEGRLSLSLGSLSCFAEDMR